MYTYKELGTVFLIGGASYGIIEILFRGYTHWSMILTGGICLLIFYIINFKLQTNSLPIRCIISSLIITTSELIVGYIVNILLKWNVWDYSHMPYNLKGQICLSFSGIWLILGIPMTILSEKLRKKLYLKQ